MAKFSQTPGIQPTIIFVQELSCPVPVVTGALATVSPGTQWKGSSPETIDALVFYNSNIWRKKEAVLHNPVLQAYITICDDIHDGEKSTVDYAVSHHKWFLSGIWLESVAHPGASVVALSFHCPKNGKKNPEIWNLIRAVVHCCCKKWSVQHGVPVIIGADFNFHKEQVRQMLDTDFGANVKVCFCRNSDQ